MVVYPMTEHFFRLKNLSVIITVNYVTFFSSYNKMNFGKYCKATWINFMKKFSKYRKLQDLQGNIREITFKAFDYFTFVHLIVNYVTLSFIQSLHGINFKHTIAHNCL